MMDNETRQICADQLTDLSGLLRNLPSGIFTNTDNVVLTTSIGAHVRHLLDHYDCLLDNLAAGHVDYACRSRDTRTEADVRFAATRCDALAERLRALPAPASLTLTVSHEPGDPALAPNASSLGRELEFLHSHTAHHFALIAVLLLRNGLSIPQDFGIARSTVLHRASLTAVDGAERGGA